MPHTIIIALCGESLIWLLTVVTVHNYTAEPRALHGVHHWDPAGCPV